MCGGGGWGREGREGGREGEEEGERTFHISYQNIVCGLTDYVPQLPHTHTHTPHSMHSFDPTRLLLSLGADVLAVDNNSCTGESPIPDFMSYSVRYSSSL